VSLGEIMLRLDPGEDRIASARQFRAWEGGGEYNVARALARCFGLDTAVVTALADNPVGRLIEDLVRQAGVDRRYIRWVPYDGIGLSVRNGLNFVERGFGIRAPVGVSDRGHSAASQIRPGDVDWRQIFDRDRTRWFHTGGIFAGLSPETALVAREAMIAARSAGAIISYDANYRPSLWQARGGARAAREVHRSLAPFVDVMLATESDLAGILDNDAPPPAALAKTEALVSDSLLATMARFGREFPTISLTVATVRRPASASRQDWTAVAWQDGRTIGAPLHRELEVLDRVGSGDAFAAGLITGLLQGWELERSLACGAALGALTMTTPGDGTMVTSDEVFQVMSGAPAHITR
jgi:2-dehydro-3-deoxygluconokinase